MDVAELALKVDSKDVLTANQRMGGLNRTASRSPGLIKAFAGAVAAVGLVSLARDAIKTYSAFETMNASLKTVTGSTELAAIAMSQIEDFASTTPFSLQQATQGFIKLKSLGLDPSAEAMRSYGNTAAAMGKELNQAVEAVADATTGEFERLKEFGIRSKTVGDNVEFTFQGVTTTVKKNATEIEGYFRSIGDVNFAGAMTDQMDTIKGASSNLSDNFEKLQRNFVEATGLGDAYKETLLGISEAIGEIDFDIISAELSTWSEFGDDISDVYDEFKKLIGQFSDFDGVIDQSGLTLKDYFLDFPVWAKAAWDKLIAYGKFALDWIDISFGILDLKLGDIWTHIAGEFKVAFYGMKEAAAQISYDIGKSFSSLLKDAAVLAKQAKLNTLAEGLAAQAEAIRVSTSDNLTEAIVNKINAEDEYSQQLSANATAIANNEKALLGLSETRDKALNAAQDSVYAAKEEREAQVELTRLMNEAEKQFQDLDAAYAKNTQKKKENTDSGNNNSKSNKDAANSRKQALDAIKLENLERQLGFDLIKGLTQEESKAQAQKKELWKAQDEHNQKLEDSIKTRNDALESIKLENLERELGFKLISGLTEEESKAEAMKQRLWKAQDSYNQSIKDANIFLKDLIETNTLQQELNESGLKFTLDEYKTYKKLNPEKKKAFEIEIKRQKVFEKTQESTSAYKQDLKNLNFEIEFNKRVLEDGSEAAEKWADSIEYGSRKAAENIEILKKQRDAQFAQIETIGGLSDAFQDLIAGGNSTDFADSIIDALAGDEVNKVMDDFFKRLAKGGEGAFGGLLDGLGGLFNTGGGAGGATSGAGLLSNFGQGAGLVSAFGGSQNSQIGGALGGAAGSAIVASIGGAAAGAVAGSVIPVIGTIIGALLGSLIGPRPGKLKFDQGFDNVESERYDYKNWISGREGSDAYTRSTDFGDFGVSNKSFKIHRLGDEFVAGVQDALDAMEETDNLISKITSNFDDNRIRLALTEQEIGKGTDLEGFAAQRLSIIAQNLNPVLSKLIDFDSKKPEELALRIGQIVEASEIGVPILEGFGFNLNGVLSGVDDFTNGISDSFLAISGKPAKGAYEQNLSEQVSAFSEQIRQKQQEIQDLLDSPPVMRETNNGYVVDANAMRQRDQLVQQLTGQILGLEQARDAVNSQTFAQAEVERLNALKTATTVALSDLAGGFDQVVSLYDNYTKKLLTSEEQFVITRMNSQKIVDKFNQTAGLSGSAAITSAEGLKLYIESLKTSGALATEEGQKNYIQALQSVDAYKFLSDARAAEVAQLEVLHGLGIRAGEGVNVFSDSMDTIINKVGGYSDFVFTAQEKLTIAQGNAAMSIKNVTDQYGLAANDLDTAAELRAQVDAANAAGDYDKVAALLQVTESVKVLSEAGVSSQDALSGVNEELRNVVGGVQDVVEPFTSINVILEDVVENQLPSAAVTIQEIAEDINSIDYSNNKVIDLQAYNRDKEQQELAAMKDQLASLNSTSVQSKNATEALTGLTSATLETLRRIDAKTADGNS